MSGSTAMSTGAVLLAAGSMALSAYTLFSFPSFQPTIDGNCYNHTSAQSAQGCDTQSAALTGGYCIGDWKAAPSCK